MSREMRKEHIFHGSVLKRLAGYLNGYGKTILVVLLLVLAITALELYKPIIIGDAIDLYINKEVARTEGLSAKELLEVRSSDFFGMLRAGILYLAVLLAIFVCNVIQTWKLQKMGQSIIYKIREEVFAHMQTLSMDFFNNTPVGKLVTRVTNDTEALNEMYSTILVKLFRNCIKIAGYAVVMVSIDETLALYSFLFLPPVGALIVIFRSLSRKAYRLTRNKLTDLNTFLSENLSGMKLIQIFAREKEKYQEFEGKNRGLYRAYFREIIIFAIFRPMIYVASVLALITVLYQGGSLVLGGTVSIGTLFIFVSYISSFFEPIQELAEQFGTLQSSLASGEKVFSILDEQPDIVNPANPVSIKEFTGKIEFSHVWFAYEGEDYILKDVSFTIQPGEKVAFVGATGAGKTSILNLIGRYYDIQKGEIRIDGVNIKELDISRLRAAIGQVQQDVFIFTGDIKSNIRLKKEEISMEKIREASRHVNASEFIEKLPHGYDEPVTERGATLSAGQRQLLSFARTLAFEPKILVMDEATANIDTETEGLIQQALEKLMEGRTTIMVAHRLSTIQHADKIIVMHKGQIRESGTHQELLNQDGIYKRLYELQLS